LEDRNELKLKKKKEKKEKKQAFGDGSWNEKLNVVTGGKKVVFLLNRAEQKKNNPKSPSHEKGFPDRFLRTQGRYLGGPGWQGKGACGGKVVHGNKAKM